MRWLEQNYTVEFRDCDPSNTVYNSRYLEWFERARFRIAGDAGLNQYIAAMMREKENRNYITFPVLEAEIKFLLPIPCGEKLLIRTALLPTGTSYLNFRHVITDKYGGICYAKGRTATGVVLADQGMIYRLPEEVDELIRKYCSGSEGDQE